MKIGGWGGCRIEGNEKAPTGDGWGVRFKLKLLKTVLGCFV
jgi:hypothetical protein